MSSTVTSMFISFKPFLTNEECPFKFVPPAVSSPTKRVGIVDWPYELASHFWKASDVPNWSKGYRTNNKNGSVSSNKLKRLVSLYNLLQHLCICTPIYRCMMMYVCIWIYTYMMSYPQWVSHNLTKKSSKHHVVVSRLSDDAWITSRFLVSTAISENLRKISTSKNRD